MSTLDKPPWVHRDIPLLNAVLFGLFLLELVYCAYSLTVPPGAAPLTSS